MTTTSPHYQTRTTSIGTTPRRRGRSAAAIAIGFLVVAALSLAMDEILHLLAVYPPWGQPLREPSLNLLAFSYRSIFTVAGMYLTATLAPNAPMRHALIGGAIGTVVAAAAAVATIPMDLGPAWYPIALAITALPLAWTGGALYRARHASVR
ncbi:MAG: hypothetical protein ABIT20_10080 [Gemmatimonadaceae bacterium]